MAILVVHGGAARIARADVAAHESACTSAVARGHAVLAAGGSALDAVVEAVVALEDDPVTNAGTGAALNRDGVVELDALVMAGDTLALGAVAAIRDVKNPIRVARALLDIATVNLLAGDGASRFAREVGIPAIDPEALVTASAREDWRRRTAAASADTVGAVATDDRGRTAAAVSTGGIGGKRPGRIGDTPLVGSGAYADDRVGAAVATGVGEDIMRVLLARTALDFLAQGLPPMAAARAAIAVLADRVNGQGGVILVDRHGEPGIAFNTPQMSHAWGRTGESIRSAH